MAKQSYEERIEDIHKLMGRTIDLPKLTEYCMDLKVSEFDELENKVHILYDTGNIDGLTELAIEISTK